MKEGLITKKKVFLTLYSLISFVFTSLHEPWRDEAQAWLLARDTGFFEIFSFIRYEGSPVLWHLSLKILIFLGFPYRSMFYFHNILIIVTAYLILTYSDIDDWYKYPLIIGYYFTYEYNIIARNYALTFLFLMLIAKEWKFDELPNKKMIAFILLLSHTNAHGMMMSMAIMFTLSILLFKEQRTYLIKILAVYLLNLSLLIYFLLSPPDLATHLSGWNIHFSLVVSIKKYLVSTTIAFVPIFRFDNKYWGATIFSGILAHIIAITVILLIAYQFRYKPMTFLTFFSVYFGFFIFFTLKYAACPRHCGLLFQFYVFCWWISKKEQNSTIISDKLSINIPRISFDWRKLVRLDPRKIFVVLFILIQVSSTITPYYQEATKNFSGAEDIATYLNTNGYSTPNNLIITYPAPIGSSIVPFLEGIDQVYSLELMDYFSYIKWTTDYSEDRGMTVEEIMSRITEAQDIITPVETLFITGSPMENSLFLQNFTLIYSQTNNIIEGEPAYIYYFNI